VGFFGGFVFDRREWHDWDPDAGTVPLVDEPWLSLLIHDSDITTIAYAPSGSGSGVAYLGTTPRVYFGDATASAPTNTELEADALARWLTQSGRARDDADEQRVRDTIVGYLATDEPSRSGDVDTDLDDADVFVEIKTVRLLRSIGLPVPEALAEVES
jgi:hypothetical protein